MSRQLLIGIAFATITVVTGMLIWQKQDTSRTRRDIAESIERSRILKAERDSVVRIAEEKRFKKKFEEAEKIEEIEESGNRGTSSNAGGVVVTTVSTNSSSEKNTVSADTENASVPSGRFFTTGAMDGLTPIGKTTQFKIGGIVYVYAGIHAPQAEQVRLEWIDPSGKPLPPPVMVNVEFNTSSTGYRIYKYRKFQSVGNYTVQLYNSAGKMIGKAQFRIEE